MESARKKLKLKRFNVDELVPQRTTEKRGVRDTLAKIRLTKGSVHRSTSLQYYEYPNLSSAHSALAHCSLPCSRHSRQYKLAAVVGRPAPSISSVTVLVLVGPRRHRNAIPSMFGRSVRRALVRPAILRPELRPRRRSLLLRRTPVRRRTTISVRILEAGIPPAVPLVAPACWRGRRQRSSRRRMHALLRIRLVLPHIRQITRELRSRRWQSGPGRSHWAAPWQPRRWCCHFCRVPVHKLL